MEPSVYSLLVVLEGWTNTWLEVLTFLISVAFMVIIETRYCYKTIVK